MKNNLFNLLLKNKGVQGAYRVEMSEDDDEATIYLYDAIGGWYGIEALAFVRDLAALSASVINLRINSPGGDVFEARAIATAIKAHPSKIIAHIDGLAASAVTYIAVSCDEVVMAKGSFFMIHNGWTFAMGDKGELKKVVALLEKIDISIVDDYESKTLIGRSEIVSWMNEETWFSAEEALEYGFIDSIFEGGGTAENKWDLSAYERPPAALLDRPAANDGAQHRAHLERRLQMMQKLG